ncbi:hypothetical protein MPDQ_008181 [Monascus purpureus]|uniref:Coupling of ubiquitin conjugation to ER degradation protein 1 n=1 Tax=Monascus purpureus TaxID=5098 RepID=A0A507QSS4_MONPU|nr:hypothetical protein MPDQ_008181 [Monascus purpureus]BDD56083.1 hypothetical protein MAP00_001560 [Monascus purpureus]
MSDDEPSINIPSLLTLAVVSFFVIRWFLNRDSNSPTDGSGSRRARGNAVDPAHVEQVSQMFPQLSVREIMWDLQRNGGSVAATTERILSGRGLEVPPLSFQPQINIPSVQNVATQTAAARSTSSKSDAQDLITRYNLKDRIASDDSSESSSSSTGWSQNKEERHRLLQKRRDDMILAARRKIMEKDRETAR